jgi:hypothetical protein
LKLSRAAAVLIFVLLFAAGAVVNISAYTISFTVFSEKEREYIYEDVGSANSNGSRFCDGVAFIIYEFPVSPDDKYVSLNWSIANQYAVYVCVTNPDNMDEWKPIYFLERPADADKPDWSPFNLKNITHDLSKYAPLCTQGKIWIIMADSDPSGGWGGYISNTAPVVFKTSQKEPVKDAVPEYVPTVKETETAISLLPDGTITTPDNMPEAGNADTPQKRDTALGAAGVIVAALAFAAAYVARRGF